MYCDNIYSRFTDWADADLMQKKKKLILGIYFESWADFLYYAIDVLGMDTVIVFVQTALWYT